MSGIRLPDLPEVQPGKATWDFDGSMRRGHLCIVALTRQVQGQGTWRLDRIAKVHRGPRGRREIVAVASDIPLILNRPEAWDGERHWFAYALDTTPGDIRARELWAWWIAEGQPTWQWPSRVRAVILCFVIRSERVA